jgi:hypothetical protein
VAWGQLVRGLNLEGANYVLDILRQEVAKQQRAEEQAAEIARRLSYSSGAVDGFIKSRCKAPELKISINSRGEPKWGVDFDSMYLNFPKYEDAASFVADYAGLTEQTKDGLLRRYEASRQKFWLWKYGISDIESDE